MLMPASRHSAPGDAAGRNEVGKRDTGRPVSRFAFSGLRLDSAGYKRVFAQKLSESGRTVIVCFQAQGDGVSGRFGVTVGKRSIAEAVDRVRARRLLREAWRLSRPSLRQDVDMVLVARAGIRGKSAQMVREDFERVCRRAGLWADA